MEFTDSGIAVCRSTPATRRGALRLLAATAAGGALAGGALAGGEPAAARRRRREAGDPVTPSSRWRELGDTPASTFRREFARLGSPMEREAEAIRAELDGFSRLYLAMSFHETKHATYQEIIPASRHNALAVKQTDGSGRWDRYPSFRVGARDWVRRLTDPDGPYAEADTLRDLIEIYAPRFENKVRRYLITLVEQIERFPLEPTADRDDRTGRSTVRNRAR